MSDFYPSVGWGIQTAATTLILILPRGEWGREREREREREGESSPATKNCTEMGRSPRCSKDGLNKGAWTALEDEMLVDYVKSHGEGKWSNLAKETGERLEPSITTSIRSPFPGCIYI
jgi:hypothetical protein